MKGTALASTVTLMDITGVAKHIISTSFKPIEVFIVAGSIYLCLTFLIQYLLKLQKINLRSMFKVSCIQLCSGKNSKQNLKISKSNFKSYKAKFRFDYYTETSSLFGLIKKN